VWVEIVDVNDNGPRFPEERLVHQLSEATAVGSTFAVPAAVDPDSRRNGVARYELRPSDGAFRLSVRHNALADADSDLRVVLVEQLDREVNDSYQVRHRAVRHASKPVVLYAAFTNLSPPQTLFRPQD